jgi:thioesterase domain-containing protein
MSSTPPLRIHGEVARGFESVRVLFEREMHTMAEEHAQLCVYHRARGRAVVVGHDFGGAVAWHD